MCLFAYDARHKERNPSLLGRARTPRWRRGFHSEWDGSFTVRRVPFKIPNIVKVRRNGVPQRLEGAIGVFVQEKLAVKNEA